MPLFDIHLPLLTLCTQLNTTLLANVFSPQTANNQRWIADDATPSFHRNHVVHLLPVIIAFHFETLVHALRPLDLVMWQQLSTRMDDYDRFVVERCTKTALSNDNSHHFTACYLPVQQPKTESFPNALRTPIIVISTHVAPQNFPQ